LKPEQTLKKEKTENEVYSLYAGLTLPNVGRAAKRSQVNSSLSAAGVGKKDSVFKGRRDERTESHCNNVRKPLRKVQSAKHEQGAEERRANAGPQHQKRRKRCRIKSKAIKQGK